MARSLRSLSGSSLAAAPTPRFIPAPPMKARRCHCPSRQRQPSFGCDPVSNHALVEELQKHGAVVDFLDRPMSRDPHDQLLLQIRGAVAEYERTLITERMRRGRLRKLRAGTLLPWTRPPYGYRLDPERPRDPTGVRLDEAEAAVVRDLFARFTDEGAAVTALVQHLHRLGIPSPRGHRSWSTSVLRNLLS